MEQHTLELNKTLRNNHTCYILIPSKKMTEQIVLYLHLVVEVCARGASQRFLGWDITVPFYDIRKEVSVLFGLIAEVHADRKLFSFFLVII